jgi:hypothetical protein
MCTAEARGQVALVAAGIALAAHVVIAGVDVKVEFDKAFDFKGAHTWAWNPAGPGEVRMARTAEDDPDAMRARAEPVIVEAVTTELGRRGLQPADATPDLLVTYYLLLTIGTSAQTLGQFLPATPEWGLPPFAPATQSFKIMNHGSLVLDLSAGGRVIWRGVAQANVKIGSDDKAREARLREAVRDLLRRYPL